MRKTNKGKYKPTNPKKYVGDPNGIVYRSSWERRCMDYFDKSSTIIKWASEEVIIPYRCPFTGKRRRYFPDFVIEVMQPDKSIKTILIEVKPYKQTIAPKVQKRKTKRYIQEVFDWGTNSNKWEAAEKYCLKRGWEFQKWTERNMGFT